MDSWTTQGTEHITPLQQGPPDSVDAPRQVAVTFNLVISAGVTPAVFVVGCVGSTLSAAVFWRQGLGSRINFCLFCLALADLGSVTVYFLLRAEQAYRELVAPSGFILKHFLGEVLTLSCLGLTGFNHVSQFLSAVIACERCFCVVSPLKAQRMLSTRRMAAVIVVATLVILGLYCPAVGPKHTTSLVLNPLTNVTSEVNTVTRYYLDNQVFIDIVDKFVFNTALPVLILVVIFLTTAVTVLKLQQAARWRLQTVYGQGQKAKDADNVSNRDDQRLATATLREAALTRMLVMSSVLYMACAVPVIMLQISAFAIKDLKNTGRYGNISVIVWSLGNLLIVINNSFNFFIYCAMGSKFRATLRDVVCCCYSRNPPGDAVNSLSKDVSFTLTTELPTA